MKIEIFLGKTKTMKVFDGVWEIFRK